MMSSMRIITATPGDYEIIIDLWTTSGLPHKPSGRDQKERILKEMNRGCGVFFIAKADQNPVGVVLVTHDGRKGWINRLAVIPEHRQSGVGRKLVEAGEQWLQEEGIGIIACLIETYNDTSLDAFQKMGYVPFGEIHYLTKRIHPDI